MSNKLKTLIFLPILSLAITACTIQDLPVIGPTLVSIIPSGVLPSGGGGPVTLNVWGLWEDINVVNFMIQQYNEQQKPDVTINYEDRSIMKLVDYKERVFTRSSDETAQVDIVMVHNSWVQRLSPLLAPMPSNLMQATDYSQRFYPVATKSAVINNEIFAVPAFYDGLVLVYNKAHFDEIGQRFPPTAWEEFRRLALELTVRGEDDKLIRSGAAIGAASNVDHFSDILGLMWVQAGVSIPQGIDSKPAYDALSYYTNFVKEDRVWNETMPEASSSFVAGKVSMIFVPSWQLIDILNATPDINDVGVAPVPQAIPESPATWGTFWMYAVPANSPNKDAAWEYLNFLVQDQQQLIRYSEASKIRAFGPPYSSVSLASDASNPVLEPLLGTANFAQSAEIASRAGNRRQVEAIRTAINDVLNGASAQESMQVVKEIINK